jgi:hypothetical protein
MCKHAQMNFMALCSAASAAQRGGQPALESRDAAFDLCAVAIFSRRELAVHLPAVSGFGPSTASAAVQINHAGTNTQCLARIRMIVLGVITCVRQHTVQWQAGVRLVQNRAKKWGILAGTIRDHHVDEQMRGVVAGQGQLGPASELIAFLACPPGVVAGARPRVHARRVDAGFRALFNELSASSLAKYRVHKLLARTFFKRRCWALKRHE